MSLISFTDRGIYCARADVYIDPWKPVRRALITHGHSDHSRWGHKKYVATHASIPVIKYRLGEIKISGINFGEAFMVNGVKISFHPAGHIIGSAQIRLEYKGEIWVISGDYKLVDDGVCTPFEPIKCTHFITESTFGLPVFQWNPQATVFNEINDWWRKNKEEEKVSILSTYSLGKAQRVINNLDHSIGKIFTHGAIENTNKILRNAGIEIAKTHRVLNDYHYQDYKGNMVIATPSGIGSGWVKKFKHYSVGIASGWMAMRGTRRRRAADRGFVLSDHADWNELNEAIAATGAENIFVTHGYTSIFTKWLIEQGYNAREVRTEFSGDETTEE